MDTPPEYYRPIRLIIHNADLPRLVNNQIRSATNNQSIITTMSINRHPTNTHVTVHVSQKVWRHKTHHSTTETSNRRNIPHNPGYTSVPARPLFLTIPRHIKRLSTNLQTFPLLYYRYTLPSLTRSPDSSPRNFNGGR